MFYKIIEWIKKIFAQKEPGQAPEVAIDDKTIKSIELWAKMYEDNPPWAYGGENKSAGIPGAIASELARLTTLELKSEITGSPRAEFLNINYKKVLEKLRIQTEYACALGGLIIKPYVANKQINVEFIQADKFVPTGFSDGKIISCQFVEQIAKEGKIFTRIESHDFDGVNCRVQNKAYQSTRKDSLGHEINLIDVKEWAELEEDITIKNVKGLLLAYFKIPQANNKNRQSPFGVSVYSKAEDLIREADEQWTRIWWEFKGSELAIDASESLFKIDASGKKVLPKGKERLFRQYELNSGITEKPLLNTFSPVIRDSSLFNGFNQILRRIEFACGLAYGTLSDVQDNDKTATEVIFSKQRSYAFVSDIQRALQNALEDLVEAMDIWVTLYNLAPAGKYEMSFDFDDSLILDSAKENHLMLQEAAAGMIKKEIYLMRRYGVTEEQAKEMIPSQVDMIPEE